MKVPIDSLKPVNIEKGQPFGCPFMIIMREYFKYSIRLKA